MINQRVTIKDIDSVKEKYRGKKATVLSEHRNKKNIAISAVISVDGIGDIVSIFASQLEENL